MTNIAIYKIPDSWHVEALISEISNKFSIQSSAKMLQRQTFLDTFDWRLFNNGATLIREGNEYFLRSLQTGESLDKSIAASKRRLKFWWDFPSGSLKNTLKNYLDVRALLLLAEIEVTKASLRVLDADQKTVLRIDIENCFLIQQRQRNAIANYIKLMPVKGYDEEFADVNAWLNEQGINEEIKPIFFLALEAAGKKPGDYTSKLNFALQPNIMARAAVPVILRFLLHIMEENVAGIKADIDTEFLHEFRVAIRRTRSALSQIRGVFPRDIRDQFKRDFSILQKASNHLRDLDVYLLSKEKYQQMLPEHLRSGLEPLFEQLQAERIAELKKLIKVIDSNYYKKLIESWTEFLDSEANQPETKNSEKLIIHLARKFIAQAYDRVINAGSKIKADSPTSALHQLRIECKKLRYLLEFFTSLFPEAEIAFLVRHLKKLQDNLGNYNDLSIQQRSLKKYLESLSLDNAASLQISSAIGGLLAGLYQQQQTIRSAFAQTFAEFIGQDNEKIYEKLFV